MSCFRNFNINKDFNKWYSGSRKKTHTAKILTEQNLSKKKILDKLATGKVRTELKLEAIRFKKQQEPIKQIDSDLEKHFRTKFEWSYLWRTPRQVGNKIK